MTTLRTKRTLLRPVDPGDANDVYAIYSRPEVCKYFDILPFEEMSQAERHVARWVQLAREGRQFRQAIVVDGRLVGTCGIYSVSTPHKRASIGFDLHPDHWGRGTMTEALEAYVPYVFEEYGIRRLQGLVMQDNRASVRLMEKLGFVYEGTLKEYEYWEGKGFVDLAMYSLLAASSRQS